MSDKKLVIIPTYNEIENIEDIISCVFSLEEDFDILIVDDSSPDGTGETVADLIPTYSNRLFLEVRSTKNGLGRAYIHGFKWALQKGYDYIFEMDADFSHNPNDLIKLYQACKNGADLAVGSRYCQGVNVVNWPMNRVLLSFFASKYVRLITGLPINDSTAGFVCFTRKVLEELPLDQVELVGYGFQIEMKFRAYCKKFKIVEIPIIFTDRTKGKSKMSGAIISEAVFGVIKMKFMSLLGRL
ncbi:MULTISPECIES: polyprenol monophosphomannose synthase [unclassified Apibacter]|uniref:polyprenol monophosphomannose synthase n=1 Tax=unclassified Apibacter TaxID=2630820 RepID=UPI0013286ADB|nr:glycosyltransferase [Apibacter sp. B3883]MXO42410.1 glycosyltransferase [Apibacter sp. B3889]MXP04427.1 glycosyltransferase [Apibacter sp. B3887]MXP05801.1 glycosyltransferase [Apibacter sp. B3546]MXP08392.1 glycosyltransferase [Apibacter sp. B3935]MXP11841.1 glycosyltransferase [Apibacter sp. B3239]